MPGVRGESDGEVLFSHHFPEFFFREAVGDKCHEVFFSCKSHLDTEFCEVVSGGVVFCVGVDGCVNPVTDQSVGPGEGIIGVIAFADWDSSIDTVVWRIDMSWLPKGDKLDSVQASAVDFVVAQEGSFSAKGEAGAARIVGC